MLQLVTFTKFSRVLVATVADDSEEDSDLIQLIFDCIDHISRSLPLTKTLLLYWHKNMSLFFLWNYIIDPRWYLNKSTGGLYFAAEGCGGTGSATGGVTMATGACVPPRHDSLIVTLGVILRILFLLSFTSNRRGDRTRLPELPSESRKWIQIWVFFSLILDEFQ